MTAAELDPPSQLSSETTLEKELLAVPNYNQDTISHLENENELNETLQNPPDVVISSWRVKLQIGFAFLSFILIGANDAVIGILLPRWGNYYQVDKTTLSCAFLAGSVGYLIAALNSSFLSRKLGNVKFLLLGKMSFLCGILIFCCQPPLYILLGVPLLLGFGAAILEAALNAHLAKLPNKTALLNYLHAFYGVGALLSPFLASQLLAADWSWNVIYWVLGSVSLALLISIRGIFTQADQEQVETETCAENTSPESPLKFRLVWLFAFFLLFYAGTEISLGHWSYSFLTEYRQENTELAGWLVSGYWLGLTVGRVAIAPLANKLGSKGIINTCLIGVVCGLFIFHLITLSLTSGFGLLLTGFCLGPILPTGFAFLSNVVPAHLLMGSISFIASLSSLGKALFPWLAGNVAEGFGLEMFLPYVIILAVAMVACWVVVLTRSQGQTTVQTATDSVP
ncbi:major facilitator superfamily MFS_1 [Halothece sp. PCC 7418]|uniref:MFS transporter n=1 Tax=Halothece sp. (strain PCC 7418) TaxID=65093 RepID=UPI0002A07B7E|nr:MFS transporter [Halothece sp. PCC 7418]AFZ45677.1 major facilitator superfamily MFS_1 [Halothece sp. PCC 7418]